jgi:mannose-6-phosphate isomerase
MTDLEKLTFLETTKKEIESDGFAVTSFDFERPWGGFLVIDERQIEAFVKTYFPSLPPESIDFTAKLSPKILIVAPGKRLSWQYHDRRSEVWRVIKNSAGIVTSFTNTEGSLEQLALGTQVILQQGQRHRLVGVDTWGVLAEIWQHTNPQHPSNEEDIVRLQDDFGR